MFGNGYRLNQRSEMKVLMPGTPYVLYRLMFLEQDLQINIAEK